MIEIKTVKTKKEIKEFINFPLNLYKDNPYFVPPLYMDEAKLFKDNAYLEQSETVYFNAYLDGVMAGRISGILQHASNEKWNQKRVRFTRFDCIDNQEVANRLFDEVFAWAKAKGMEEVVGPLGFNDLEREGLLIEGFEYLSTFEEQYNYPYYQTLIENYGFVKEVDWLEHRIFPPKEIDERYAKITEHTFKKYNLKFVDCKNINTYIKRYGRQLFDILDETYNHIYGVVPLTDRMINETIDTFKIFMTMDYLTTIIDEDDNIVAFGITFPGIGKAVKASGGHLTLGCIHRILKARRHPETIDFGLVGVIDKYKKTGVGAAIFYKLIASLKDINVEYGETNLNLEDNYAIINQWKTFDHIQHKRRRCFVRPVK